MKVVVIDDKKIGLDGTFTLENWRWWCTELFVNAGINPYVKTNKLHGILESQVIFLRFNVYIRNIFLNYWIERILIYQERRLEKTLRSTKI